jgi:hypothetical protein
MDRQVGQREQRELGHSKVRLGAVVLLSLFAHVVLFAALALARVTRPQAAIAAVVAVPAAVDEASPVLEVTMLEVPEAPLPPMPVLMPMPRPIPIPTTATATATASAAVPATATATATATAAVPVPASATATATAPGPDAMRMRSSSPHTETAAGLPHPTGSILESIADRPGLSPPVLPVTPSGLLEASGGGTARVDDAVTTVSVERDGTAHFHDKPDFDARFTLPFSLTKSPEQQLQETTAELGAALRNWYEDPYRDAHPGPSTDLPETQQAMPGQCDKAMDHCLPAPTVSNIAGAPPAVFVPIISGKFDATDYLMRKFVGDPYAARKRALLEHTFAERAQAGATYRAEQLDRSAEFMRQNLAQLWAREQNPVARRAELFAMWDECDEGDGASGEAGQRARMQVIGWIAVHLPRGSRDGYTPAELAELAKHRTSKQPFEPYAP